MSRIGKWLESAHIGKLVSDDRDVGQKMEGEGGVCVWGVPMTPFHILPDQLTLS